MNKNNADAFAGLYPNVARWISDHGYIEVGYDDCNQSFIRVLDIGGMVWEGEYKYPSPSEAFQALDDALAAWMQEQGYA